MARASLMTMANWKLRIDQANEKIKQADQKRLQLQVMAPGKIPYPNLQFPGNELQTATANVPHMLNFLLKTGGQTIYR